MASYVGHGCVVADSLPIASISGTPQVGDLCVAHAVALTTGVMPALPSGWTSLGTRQRGLVTARLAYRIFQLGDTDVGPFTGALSVQANVYRGMSPSVPTGTVGGSDAAAGTGQIWANTCVFGVQNGSSWLAVFCVHNSGTNVHDRTIAGITTRSAGHAEDSIYAGDTNGGVTNWPSDVDTVVNGGGTQISMDVELRSILNTPPAATAYLWEIVAGALPTGLTINSANGLISGTPTVAGLFEFSVKVSNNYLASEIFECQIYIAPGPYLVQEALPELTYALDVGEFVGKGVTRWFRHARVVKRPAVVRTREVIYVDGSNVVQLIDETDSLASGAYWTSPMLNRKNRQAEYTITRVIIRYESAFEDELVVEASGDGGITWEAGFEAETVIDATRGSIKRIIQGFNTSGYDLRFRVSLPDDGLVYLRGWRAEIIQRDQLRADA